jgi:hypothetical protein
MMIFVIKAKPLNDKNGYLNDQNEAVPMSVSFSFMKVKPLHRG